MKVFFRTDSSNNIGNGHLTRCLTLASSLNKNGIDITFISRKHYGNINYLITKNGFRLLALNSPEKNSRKLNSYEKWLGVSQEIDADETKKLIKNQKFQPDWIIVDHYALDLKWEKILKPHVGNIMVIDDIANRKHDCDILLDHNWFENKEVRYNKLVSANCIKLLGPDYLLLDSKFDKFRKKIKSVSPELKRVFIFFGGSDPNDLTNMAIRAFLSNELSSLFVDVVIGSNNRNSKKIKKLCSQRKNTKLHIQINNISSIMSKADLAIGSGGVNTWERIYLGLPSITISFSENHNILLKDLNRNGYIFHLGNYNDINTEMIKNKVVEIKNNNSLLNQRKKLISMIDGNGLEKVKSAIIKGKKIIISIVSDKDSWINNFIPKYIKKLKLNGHQVSWIHNIKKVPKGDVCILLGCSQFMDSKLRKKNLHNAVVHESALPKGRGWSPLTWQIIEGKNIIPITLIEIEEKIDTGKIYYKGKMYFKGHELVGELRKKQAKESFKLCDLYINNYHKSIDNGLAQKGKATFYKKRNKCDSELNINKSIKENFNLLRTVDNEKYPAFFHYKKNKYKITIEKYKK